MPVDHYENFPVASWLLPRHLRRPVEIIYAFARSADDFADEGELPPAERLALLDNYRQALKQIEQGSPPDSALFQNIAAIAAEYKLPIQLFHDLLDAFSQDVVKSRYANFAEVMEYCRRSANPIGRLLLHLYQRATPQNLLYSDAICSALQLINFWQDVAVDWGKNRVYLPQDNMAQFNISVGDIAAKTSKPEWQALLRNECQRARQILLSGQPLTRILPGRIGLELRMVVAGGASILDKIDAVNGDVFRHRPILTKWDWLRLSPQLL